MIRTTTLAGLSLAGHLFLALPVVLALAILSPSSLRAQLLTRAELGGVVSSDGTVVGEAVVLLVPAAGGLSREEVAGRDGRFRMEGLLPGSYDLRVESVGYRPHLLRGVTLLPGRTVHVEVPLTVEPPPVSRIDTTLMAGGTSGRSIPGLMDWVPGAEADLLPDRHRETAGLGRLSASRGGGGEGLPAGLGGVALDGVILRPAVHPGVPDDPGGSFPFPRVALGGVAFIGSGDDPEWSGAAGGIMALFSAPGGSGSTGRLFAGGSGGGLWSSGLFPGEAPAVTSFLGGGRTGFPLDGERGAVLVAAEVHRSEAPRPPALTPEALLTLQSLSSLPPGATALAEAGLDRTTTFSGMSRIDWAGDEGQAAGLTVAFGRSETEGVPAGSVILRSPLRVPGTRADLAAVGLYMVPLTDRYRLETRAGLHRSERDHSGALEGGASGVLLVGEGGGLGTDGGLPLRVSRTSAVLTSLLHYQEGNQQIKAGVEGRIASHEREGMVGGSGAFVAPGLGGLATGRGSASIVIPGTPTAEYQVKGVSAFGRLLWTPRPGLGVTFAVRYDLDQLPTSDLPADTTWARLTALGVPITDNLKGVGGSVGFSWDAGGRGETLLRGSVGVDNGEADPAMLADLIQMDGRARVRRSFGASPGWPSTPTGTSYEGALLALPGPDLGLPRTIRGSGGLTRRLAPGATLHLSGAFRRTELLVRAHDLNRIPSPRAVDQGARPLFGILGKEGGLVGALPGSNRRFPSYDHVWALNPDGWSEYLGFGAGLELAGGGWSLRTSYQFSRTEDNVPGLGLGDPLLGLDPFPGSTVDWREGRSDLDVPHRGVAEAVTGVGPLQLAAVYTLRSGSPFTPGFRPGVDVNGDGSGWNDPAILTGAPEARALLAAWGCDAPGADGALPRNACRGEAVHGLDVRVSWDGIRAGGLAVSLVVEALGLVEPTEGLRDTALYLVDASTPLAEPSGGTQALPLVANPLFGEFIRPWVPGRLLRIGFRLTPG
jgi:hypothetical protein